jgi:hypothetical protein
MFEANLAVSNPGQCVDVEVSDVFSRQPVFASSRPVEAPDKVHERRLTGP